MEYVGFDRDTYNSFKDFKDSRPLHMLNLIKLKKEAIYPDGSITTGFEAYMRYGKNLWFLNEERYYTTRGVFKAM